MSKEDLRARVDHDFGYHRPQNQATQDVMGIYREKYRTLAQHIIDFVPKGRELSMAITKLEESLMMTIAGLARHEEELISTLSRSSSPESDQE